MKAPRGTFGTNDNFPEIIDSDLVVTGGLYVKEGPTLDVRVWGARADGVTDDTAAIQAAIDACNTAGGGVVFLPPGTYLVSAIIRPKSNVWIRGAGKAATTLKLANGTNLSVIQSAVALSRCRVSDLAVNGNKANQSSGTPMGIVFTDCSFVEVVNCRVYDTHSRGIWYWNNTDCLVSNCEVSDSGAFGNINVMGTSLRVLDNIVSGSTMGIAIEGNGLSSGIVIAKNTVKDPTEIGIACGSLNPGVTVVGNYVTSLATSFGCIDPGSCLDTTVSGNVCNGGGGGIVTDGGQRQSIVSNIVRSPAGHGINILSSKDCSVVGNVVSNAGWDGINFWVVTDSLIQGNIVKNSARLLADRTGIGIESTSTGIVIAGNRCYDDQGTKTQAYGIKSSTTSDYLTVTGNDLRGNLTGAMSLVGANNLVESNQGASVPTVASAATVTLPGDPVVTISGTTTITSVTASWAGRIVTLVFSGALTFTDGSNLKLNGNFVTTADDTITLGCDGTNWIELCRSVN
jgi:parallel beta-helix repeat protein